MKSSERRRPGVKIAVKCVAGIALIIAPWLWANYFLYHTASHGKSWLIFPLWCNLLQVAGMYWRIRGKRLPDQASLALNRVLTRGMWITLGAALLACIVYLANYLIVGRNLTETWPAVQTSDRIERYVLLENLAALFVVIMLAGCVFSYAFFFVSRNRQTRSAN
jgi:hypothetical protein